MIKTLVRLIYLFFVVCIILLVMSLFMDKPKMVKCREKMTDCFNTMQQTEAFQLPARGAYCLWQDIKCAGRSLF